MENPGDMFPFSKFPLLISKYFVFQKRGKSVCACVCVCVCVCVYACIPTYAQKQSKKKLENKAFLYFNPSTLD